MGIIENIRQKIREKDYFLSAHAEEEMYEDLLERSDIEHVILKGKIQKKMTQDYRGTRYRIEGLTPDGKIVHIVCRFKEEGSLVIITVYVLEESL